MKTGLVLEGGAMRGMYTAGVIDVMMENKIKYDGMIGVSAGASFGCNYKSHQIGRVIRYNMRFCRDWRFCSLRSLITTGDLYGADFCYNKLPNELDLWDIDTYKKNPMDFYVVVTDADTGRPVYHKCPSGDATDIKWIRASASMPVASHPVVIGGHKYLDGGIADSIPVRFFRHIGYEKNVIVLTQPLDFVKEPQAHQRLISALLKKYPAVDRRLRNRHNDYNHTLTYIKNLEKKGEVFVIRPDAPLNIGSVCHDPEELYRVYEAGRKVMNRELKNLKNYLSF